jgi:hypothetical protein
MLSSSRESALRKCSAQSLHLQTPRQGLEPSEAPPEWVHIRTAVLIFEFETSGGGAWESNPPSNRKLPEQPF